MCLMSRDADNHIFCELQSLTITYSECDLRSLTITWSEPFENMIYNHSQSWLAIISDCSKKIAPIFLRRILKDLAPFFTILLGRILKVLAPIFSPFCCGEFLKIQPLFYYFLWVCMSTYSQNKWLEMILNFRSQSRKMWATITQDHDWQRPLPNEPQSLTFMIWLAMIANHIHSSVSLVLYYFFPY